MGTTVQPLPERPVPLAVRVIWIGAMAAVALLTVAVQLDAASIGRPAFARMIPGPMRHYALQPLTAEAIAYSQPVEAVAGARALVRGSPAYADPVAALALAASLDGDFDLADTAYTVGQSRGWRNEAIQRFAALTAAEAGMSDVAGYRLAALWKAVAVPESLTRETAAVLSTDKGARAFASMMVQGGAGLDRFLERAPKNLPDDRLTTVLTAFREAGYQPDCPFLAETVQTLAKEGKQSTARAVWSALCRKKELGEPGTGSLDFAPLASPAGPYGWAFPGAAGLNLKTSRTSENTWALEFTNSDMLAHVIAQRPLALAPGRYIVRGETKGDAVIRVRVRCGTNEEQVLDLSRDGAPLGIGADCPDQYLSIEVTPGSGRIGAIEIEHDSP